MSVLEKIPNRPFFMIEMERLSTDELFFIPFTTAPLAIPYEEYQVVYIVGLATPKKQTLAGFSAEKGEWEKINDYTAAGPHMFLKTAADDAYEWAVEEYPEAAHPENEDKYKKELDERGLPEDE